MICSTEFQVDDFRKLSRCCVLENYTPSEAISLLDEGIDRYLGIGRIPIPKSNGQSALKRRILRSYSQFGMDQSLMVTRPLISVVDDDESVRESLPDLLKEFGFEAQAFSSAEEFLASEAVSETSCLVLDVAMPGMTGPDLQQELTRRDQRVPIVFITAHRDARERLRLIAQGAVECLFKPFEPTDLLQALNAALRVS